MIDNKQSLEKGYILHGANYGYEIQKILGQGTFGITYLAKVKMEGSLGTLGSNVFVAVKEFFMKEINSREGTSVTSGSSDGIFYDYRKKFKKEVENLSKLSHPNIVKVMESFEANNTIYYVMEYYPGGSLDQKTGKGGLPFKEVIKFTTQIGSAVAFMHDNKMLHLDLKPSNVVLDENNNAILIDFGLSKQYDENGQPESSTTVGGGTPGYAPLEQVNFHDGKDFPTTMDVYALGATIYKMFVGERAPEASDILNEGFPVQKLSFKCHSNEMVACVEKAMAPIKKQRYQTVRDLLKTVSACNNEETTISPIEETTIVEDHVTNNGGDWGFTEEYENGNIVKRKVIDHIPLPDTIKITKEESKTGNNYAVVLHQNKKIKGYVSIVDVMGERTEKEIPGGIPDDVMRLLKNTGFFSPTHWERYESKVDWKEDPVEVDFEYKGDTRFCRFSDAPGERRLHRAVEGLLFNTSLDKYISVLTMKEDFEPDDILKREECIYGGPPVDEQEKKTEQKDKEDDGCMVYLFALLAVALQCLYPATWCLTFLSDRISYPNLWSVGVIWILGVIIGICIIGSNNKKLWLRNIWIWSLLITETVIVYILNYI